MGFSAVGTAFCKSTVVKFMARDISCGHAEQTNACSVTPRPSQARPPHAPCQPRAGAVERGQPPVRVVDARLVTLRRRQASQPHAPCRPRAQVLWNEASRQFVMWMHVDDANYEAARVGVATAPRAAGPFAYRGSFRPHGHQSRDLTLFLVRWEEVG